MNLWSGALALTIVLAGCAGYDGRSLTPGVSTGADVEKQMGPSAE